MSESQNILHVEAPFGESRVLLHACCAPCSSAIVECLVHNGIRPTIYYCNPNIYPQEEYLIRKNECTRYAQSLGLEIVDADYDHESWRCWIAGREDEPERGARCLECFKLRLLRTAEYARAHGFRVITTTLASSRWKSLDQINAAGRWAVETALGDAVADGSGSGLAPLSMGICSARPSASPASCPAKLLWEKIARLRSRRRH